MENATTYRPHVTRRRLLVKPALQWKYTAWALWGVFIVSAVVTVLLFAMLFNRTRIREMYSGATTPWDLTVILCLTALGFATVIAVAFGIWTIIATHRVCGPMLVVERFLKEIIEGRLPKRRSLRKHDEFQDFYETFWQAMNALKAARRSDLARLTEICNMLHSAQHADDPTRKRVVHMVLPRVQAMRDEAVEQLGAATEESDAPAPAERHSTTTRHQDALV